VNSSGDPVARILRGTPLFEYLDVVAFDALLADVLQVTAEPGAVIIREGDFGDALYVVLEGTVQIYTAGGSGAVLVLDKVGPGGYFGEQALLPGRSGRRNASVRAHSGAVLLRIRKDTFQRALAENHPLKEHLLQVGEEQLRTRLVRQSTLFQSLELGAVDAESTERSFRDGDVLFREGEPADRLYVILAGRAAVFQQRDGRPVLLARLAEGQCIGELALLSRSVRSATVVAEGPLRVFEIGSQRFLDLYARSPELREYMQTLERVYQIPRRGFVTQHTGHFLERDSITTLYHLLDGRRLAAFRVVGEEIFNLEQAAGERAPVPDTLTLRYEDETQGVERELRLTPDGALLGITAHGRWPELAELCLLAIDGRALTPEQRDRFRRSGSCGLQAELLAGRDADVVCNCMRVERGAIRRVIAAGCQRLEEVQQRTSCGTVCGGCVPLVLEMLGRCDWTAVAVEDGREVAAGIRRFRLKPFDSAPLPAQPGQHIVVQAQIDGRWVQRPYTLSSASGETEFYEVTVKREAQGTFSRWLFEQRRPDSLVRVSRPQGTFVWERHMDPVVCLVGGIGVTPALAICRTVVRQGLTPTVHIDYSGRHAADIACAEELQAAAAAHSHIRVTLRQTGRDGRLAQGDVHALVARYPKAWFFVCGPVSYLTSVAGYLAQSGVPSERIRTEVFVHAGDPPAPGDAPGPGLGDTPGDRRAPVDNLLVAPRPPTRRPVREAIARLARGAADLANSRLADWGPVGRPLNPVRLVLDRLVARAARLDPRLPKDHWGVVGTLAKGPITHQLEGFERYARRYRPLRQRALDARRDGTPLSPTTPDGDTWAYAIPNAPLVQFDGPHAVDTGWKRAGDGLLLPVYVTRSPTALRALLGGNPTFDRGPLPYHYYQQILGFPEVVPDACRKAAGLGVGQVHGNQTWEWERDIFLELFGPSTLTGHAAAMGAVLGDVAATIETHIDARPDELIDGTELALGIAYDVAIQAMFGNAAAGEFRALGATLRDPLRRTFQFVAAQLAGKRGSVPAFQADVARMRSTVEEMIAALRRAAAEGQLDDRQRALPAVRLILGGNGHPAVPDSALVPVVLGAVSGTHETTGFTLAWALYELGRDPAVRTAVLAELDAFHHAHAGRPVTAAQYDERPCMQALFYELGRRHPPAYVVPRTALREGEMPPDSEMGIGAFRYPKDTLFLCSIVGAHMDPDTYPDPHVFRLDRYFTGVAPGMSLTEQGRQVRANARRLEDGMRLLPFSAGPGHCLGRSFAMLVVFRALDHLLRRFSFELEDPSREVLGSQASLSGPAPGELRMRIRRRPR
jgi:ferredoxin-NADP reductase/CRP-like cAMP-binding protein/cytochrome P450